LSSSRAGAILKIVLFVCVVILGNVLTEWFTERLDFELRPSNEHIVHRVIMLSSVAYVVLMSIPFVPGVEIGLALLVILGPNIAALVYVCTLVALSLSFAIGRLIPERVLIAFFKDLHLEKVGGLLERLEGLDAQERLGILVNRAPTRIVPFLLRYRYVALVVAVNLPGNVLIGGGGGIAMMAGLSRLFSPLAFLATLAIAIAPVPLIWATFGANLAEWVS